MERDKVFVPFAFPLLLNDFSEKEAVIPLEAFTFDPKASITFFAAGSFWALVNKKEQNIKILAM
jgi:hypothetical protein